MERESFEDNEVADILNKSFIAIKVDREERPDVDSVYMSFCQALTGQGGWPLTIIMTPDKKPFYAGTYFPKKSKYGYPGLIDVLDKIRVMWHEARDKLIASSEEINKAIKDSVAHDKGELDISIIHDTYEQLENSFDSVYGGFGTAPKFPTPHTISFLLRYYKATGKEKALEIAEKTLQSMYKGGIFDHIGLGFSRYSTDEKWLVPHFEKMLYDNALLAIAYIEAYQVTNKELYSIIAKKIFGYVLRDMTSSEGGFYSAEDADSEGVEGKFYVWEVDEITKILGEEDSRLFCEYYNILDRVNFEGKNIPNLITTVLEDIDKNIEVKNKLEKCKERLFEYREKRIHPYKDDKILTSWNGLMIAAMAYGGRVFDDKDYIDAAQNAANFIIEKLTRKDGRLLVRYRQGESAYEGYLTDYAYFVWGLIELYETTFDVDYLEKAIELNDDMIDYFWDEEDGGLYIYGRDSEELVIRPKEIYDSATPSGNSVATLNMLRLSKITGNSNLQEKALSQFEVFGGNVKKYSSGYAHFMMAYLFSRITSKEIVIVAEKEDNNFNNYINEINKRFLPFSTVVLNNKNEELYKYVPFVKEQVQQDNKTTVYVCQNFTCSSPTTEIEQFTKLLEKEDVLK